MSFEDLIERTETAAIQRSRHPEDAQFARDVLAVLRVARAAKTISEHLEQSGYGALVTEQWIIDSSELLNEIQAVSDEPSG